jgi:U3 small nucleolar RNA-associated protein 25
MNPYPESEQSQSDVSDDSADEDDEEEEEEAQPISNAYAALLQSYSARDTGAERKKKRKLGHEQNEEPTTKRLRSASIDSASAQLLDDVAAADGTAPDQEAEQVDSEEEPIEDEDNTVGPPPFYAPAWYITVANFSRNRSWNKHTRPTSRTLMRRS